MNWKQRISVVVLVLLTSLPVSGTLCAMMCDSAAAAASGHHGSDTDCEEVARASTGVHIEGASDHGCSNHDAAIRQVASTAADRVQVQAAAIVFTLPFRHTSFGSSLLIVDDASPPGTAPRTIAPLVLRV